MDRISQLHDELLLGILSSLPTAKDVAATMVLSKRWRFLWMMVPRLVYNACYQDIDYGRFSTLVNRFLLLHKAPLIDTLHFKIGNACSSGDIPALIRAADERCVHELIIEIFTHNSNYTPVTLPRSLFTWCKMLVTLTLRNAVLTDDVTYPVSFPSLKNLSLISMKYPGGDEFFNTLISSCPILEDLVVKQILNDNVSMVTVRVPSLKRLVLNQEVKNAVNGIANGFVINTPSLECMDIVDLTTGCHIVENDMPNIVKAKVDIFHPQTEKLLGSITLAKYLHICLPTSKNVSYPAGNVFHRLVHLRICTCETEWINLLMRMLRNSPSLRVLEIEQAHFLRSYQPRPCWSEPSSIPECLICNLETFKWEHYYGAEEEKEVAAFILRSTISLKKATIIPHKSIFEEKKLEMHKELSLLPICSPVCQLAFS
ncbi:Leucine-rich repeat 2 [Arabidopsis thaliana x Arabidopsis arenosa]|uniref:Leucine-rich repeat 2 n=1 Tax=Arabidopsis thaliana x Arabidopsis arenosa TaxID=1240361 RepID=A0A8T1XKZ0_9BRAS|nr:Leucine-rich repeat 2 [Arabidopsis thaliana x Arabidopsis arenosa]